VVVAGEQLPGMGEVDSPETKKNAIGKRVSDAVD
jgi:hypothetical protein